MPIFFALFFYFTILFYNYYKNAPTLEYLIKRFLYVLYEDPLLRIEMLLFFIVLALMIKLYNSFKNIIKRYQKYLDVFLFLFAVIILIKYYVQDLFKLNLEINTILEMYKYLLEHTSLFLNDVVVLFSGDYFYLVIFLFYFSFYLLLKKYIKKSNKLLYKITYFVIIIFILFISCSFFINYNHYMNKSHLNATGLESNQKPKKEWFNVSYNPVKHYFKNRWGFSINKNPNIVIFLLESVRKDKITLERSRYFNPNHPNNILLDHFYVPIPHSTNTHFTLLTGHYSPRKIHYLFYNLNTDFFRELSEKNLIYQLKKRNYQTYYITTNDTSFERERSFLEFLQLNIIEKKDLENYGLQEFEWGIDDYALYLKTQEIIQTIHNPFFILYVFSNTHTPYFNPKPEVYNKYSNRDRLGRYQNVVEYTIDIIDQIMDLYSHSSYYKNTIFILLSDHGESFGDYNYILHDFSLYNPEVQVPFVMHSSYFPYIFDKNKISYGNLLDIVPTIYDLIEMEVDHLYPGKSIFAEDYQFYFFLYPWGDKSKIGIIKSNKKWLIFYEQSEIQELDLDDNQINTYFLEGELKKFLIDWESSFPRK